MLDADRALYEKRYSAAASIYTSIIRSNEYIDTMCLHERRSSAYSLAQRLDLALADGKHMIKLNRTDSRGYIRTARTEELLGNFHSAVKILRYAMKKVSSDDLNYKALGRQLTRAETMLRRNVVYDKRADPMQTLPQELLDIVFSTITYADRVRLLTVSKTWKRWLSSTDLMAHTVDTTSSKACVSRRALHAAFIRLNGPARSLAFGRLDKYAATLVNNELRRWTRYGSLESLVIEDCQVSPQVKFEKFAKLKHFSVVHDGDLAQGRLADSIWDCPLESLQILTGCAPSEQRLYQQPVALPKHHESLKLLSLRGGDWLEGQAARCVFPNLDTLQLSDWSFGQQLDLSSYSKLKRVVLERSRGPSAVLRLPALEMFQWTLRLVAPRPHPLEFTLPGSNLRRVSLDARQTMRGIGDCLRTALDEIQKSDTIDELCLYQVCTFHDLQMRCESGWALQRVRKFCCEDVELRDEHAHDFGQVFRQLEELEIENNPHITGSFVSTLIHRTDTRLHKVILRGCEKVSPDVVFWAQSQGVDVKLFRTVHPTGKRLRYE